MNGTARTFAPGATIGSVLDTLGASRNGVAVACNDHVVPRSAYDGREVRDGDRIEIIVAVAGG